MQSTQRCDRTSVYVCIVMTHFDILCTKAMYWLRLPMCKLVHKGLRCRLAHASDRMFEMSQNPHGSHRDSRPASWGDLRRYASRQLPYEMMRSAPKPVCDLASDLASRLQLISLIFALGSIDHGAPPRCSSHNPITTL